MLLWVNLNKELKKKNGKNTLMIVGLIFLCLLIIVLVGVLDIFAYNFFLKMKVKTDEELLKGLKGINWVNRSQRVNKENKSP